MRGIFDAAGLTRDAAAALRNLITYSPDWSVWMGVQHQGEAGQWPHLDQLYGRDSIDLVAFDNYLPLSDWTTAGGGPRRGELDALAPEPEPLAARPDTMNGLGLSGEPTLLFDAYLKRNIEGGEKYDWFYEDSDNLGIGLDPLRLRPAGVPPDRRPREPRPAAGTIRARRSWRTSSCAGGGRTRTAPSTTTATAGAGCRAGRSPMGAAVEVDHHRRVRLRLDRPRDQPANVFYDPKSTESFTAFWSVWDSADGAT